DVDQPWHFCLLARIEAPTTDPMTYPETENSSENVRNNNNIASRNVTIIYVPDGGLIAGTIAIGNPSDQAKSYDLIFNADDRETGKKIFEEAEVTIKLSSDLYTAWVAGGSQKTNITTTGSLNTLKITGDNAKLKNITFNPDEFGVMALQFNFLTEEITTKEEYTYYVTQKETTTGNIIGGETYIIRKEPRSLFYANADNISANRNVTVSISVDVYDELVVYN